jgi:catechol 2,3-dioxygenase-like lactoylglutathione lyase family enzyme
MAFPSDNMSTLMNQARINHMEVTVARGTLAALMPALEAFYCGKLGFKPARLDAFPAPHVFLTSDDPGRYFIYVAEHEKPMIVGGDDHLGFHMQDRAAVDRVLEACRDFAKVDGRMEIRDLDDLDLEQTVTHAFYFRYLLPIWFDIQVIEYKPPNHR